MKKYFLCLVLSVVLVSAIIPSSDTSAINNNEIKENNLIDYCLKCDKASTIIDISSIDDKNPEKPDIINAHTPVPFISDVACKIAYKFSAKIFCSN